MVNIELRFHAYVVSAAPSILDSSTNGLGLSVILAVEQGSTSFKSKVIKLVIDPTVAVILNL